MPDTEINNDNGGNRDVRPTIPGIDPITRKFLPGNKLYLNANKQPSPSQVAMRQLKNDLVLMVAPQIIPNLLALMSDESPKIRLGATKLCLETLIPKEVIHALVGKILHEHEGDGEDKIRGLLSALPQFGEFLAYKALQDSGKVIDVKAE